MDQRIKQNDDDVFRPPMWRVVVVWFFIGLIFWLVWLFIYWIDLKITQNIIDNRMF